MRDFRSSPRISPEELHLSGACRFLRQAERIPLSTSAFTVGTLDVNNVKHVLMVLNSEEHRPDGSVKPAGWGIPGGGVLESEAPAESATREFRDECGLEATNPVWRRYEHNLLTPRPGDGFYYNKCHLFLSQGGDLSRVTRQTLVHVFTADIIHGPVTDMLQLRRALCPTEDIVVRLDSELGEKLGVEEVRTQEIEAIGLFPVIELLNREKPREGFYRSHLARLSRVLDAAPVYA